MFSSSYHHNRALEAQSHLEHLARSGDFNALLHHNLAEAHLLEFETSPERTLRGNAFRNAASSSRSMISTLPALRASACSEAQKKDLDQLQEKLDVVHKQCSDYVTVHKSKNAIAVFEAVSTFLGLEAVLPERPGQVRTLFGGGRIAVGWKESAKKETQAPVPSTDGSLTISSGEPVEVAHPSPIPTSGATTVTGSVSPPTTPATPVKDQAATTPESATAVEPTKDMSEVTAISNVTTSTETSGAPTGAHQIGPDVPTVMPLPPKENVTKEKQPAKLAAI